MQESSTIARTCADCHSELQRKGSRGSWPERCPACAETRDREIRAERDRNRVRPSRAKAPEPPRPCADCPTLVHKAKTKWPERCPECAKRRINAARRAKTQARPKQEALCVGCGQPTAAVRKVRDPRCAECRRKRRNERSRQSRQARASQRRAAEKAWRQRNPGKVTRKVARRRAWRADRVTEIFSHEEIFARDGWICQLCGDGVDRKLRFPHLLSATLDHRIPLTRPNGHHVRSNVRLAHFQCNSRKGERLDSEALHLLPYLAHTA